MLHVLKDVGVPLVLLKLDKPFFQAERTLSEPHSELEEETNISLSVGGSINS